MNAGKIQIMEKELATYDRGKCRKLFFCNFIKGEMKFAEKTNVTKMIM